MTARETMLSRLRGRNLETALERDFYCSPEDYQVDLDLIGTVIAVRGPRLRGIEPR